jgi:hypothetical protein
MGEGSILFPPHWPDEMGRWAQKHAGFVARVKDTLNDLTSPVTETQLWEIIAGNYSATWAEARKHPRTTEEHLKDLLSPENAPLGAIGSALDSVETNHAEDLHIKALAHFTLTNETLMQDKDLSRLLDILQEHQRRIDISRELTMAVQEATRDLDDLVPAPALRDKFKSYAGKLFGKKRENTPPTPAP